MRALHSFVLATVVVGLTGHASSNAARVAAGELRFASDAPRPGTTISVTYRPATSLAGRDRVMLRARTRTIHGNLSSQPSSSEGTDVRTIATLRRRGDGTFAGTFGFPDSALHMIFAVESSDATVVDANLGRYWELLAHEADGRPSLDALEQRLSDLSGRNGEEALLTSRRMLALYPDRAQALEMSWSKEQILAGADKTDSIRVAYVDKLLALVQRLGADSAALRREIPSIGQFAYWLQASAATTADSARLAPWIVRALRETPTTAEMVETQAAQIYRAYRLRRGDAAQAQADLEALWQRAGDSLYRMTRGSQPRHQFSRAGWRVALEAHDTAAFLRWHERVAVGGRYARRRSALILTDVPGTRREGMRWIRDELHAIDAMRPEHRLLGETIDQQRARAKEESRLLMAALGKGLIADGAVSAGLDSLTRAAAEGWDLETFRLIVDGRMAAGDTAGALAVQARIAADPRTPPTLVSSTAPLAERVVGRDRWTVLLAEGRADLTRRVLARTIDVAPGVPIRLTDSTGREHSLAELAGGHLTFVFYWTQQCGDAMAELAKADSVATRAAAMGLRVLSVSMDDRTPAIGEIARSKRLTNPVYFDLRKTIEHGLHQWSSPAYLLFDANGKLRFEVHSSADVVLPYAAALLGERRTASTSSGPRR